ncbi:DUF7619 domain-containing protein, partial [Bacillus toyonensis]|uniref:DUF7619 domain-containing protein n=1 Tax=Bacillus toyonensis TaxID=155322 RepID=UPI0035ED8AC6
VNTLPTPNPIPNSATSSFQYNPPNQPPINRNSTSNIVETQINATIINPTKSANQQIVNIGDIITYTITVPNNGNISATNVSITDPIPTGTTFIPNSVTVNGATQSGVTPTNIPLGTIPAGQTTTVTFQVQVTSLPANGTITNEANITFTSQPNPSEPPTTTTTTPPPTTTSVRTAIVNPTKTASPQIADIGDIITYTISLQNNGTVPSTNIVLTDPIPNGTTFIPNSVTIDGVSQPNSNPENGISIGTLNPNQAKTITFQVQVTSVPPNGLIENQGIVSFNHIVNPNEPPATKTTPTPKTETQVGTVVTAPTKSADKQVADIGDTITYTVTFTNNGTVPATNVVVTDPTPNGTIFAPNSVTIDGVSNPGSDPELGIQLGTISVGETKTITYQVVVTNLPPDGVIRNQASFTYQYQPNPSEPPVTTTTTTPSVNIPINNPNPTTTKSADRQIADLGDTITFTVTFQNRGTVPATNVIVKDTLPSGISFVPGSVVVNGTSQLGENPEIGIPVGTVNP